VGGGGGFVEVLVVVCGGGCESKSESVIMSGSGSAFFLIGDQGKRFSW